MIELIRVIAPFVVLAAMSFASAQEGPVGFDPKKRTNIDAGRVERIGQTMFAEGQVTITQPGVIITADQMEVTLIEGTSEVEKLIATGRVRYASISGDAVAGERAVFTAADNTLIVTENVVLVQETQVATGDQLVYNTLTGAVVMTAAPGGRVRGLLSEQQDGV